MYAHQAEEEVQLQQGSPCSPFFISQEGEKKPRQQQQEPEPEPERQ
jgi:hypothetical protein